MSTWRYKLTAARYADQYGVATKTIRRWAKSGVDLDDPEAVRRRAWSQRSRPRSFERGRRGRHPTNSRGVPDNIFRFLVEFQELQVDLLRSVRRAEKLVAVPGQNNEYIFGGLRQVIRESLQPRLKMFIARLALKDATTEDDGSAA